MEAHRALAAFPTTNDPTVVLAHLPASTAGLPVRVLPIAGHGELACDVYSLPRLLVAHQGRGQRWYQVGGQTRALSTAPRMIEIYEGGLSFGHCHWQGEPGRCVMLEFAPADVEAITHGELQRLDLRTEHEAFDERISQLALELAEQTLQGLPEGRLYAQGLCVALLGLMLQRQGAAFKPPPSAGRLGPAQQKRVTELIQQQLGTNLSLTRLAQEAGLSTHHFGRAFKASFGTTPHRYVQQQRLEAAAAALQRQGNERSIAQIALAHGFASQAHMTDLMRRRWGVTPRMMKRRG